MRRAPAQKKNTTSIESSDPVNPISCIALLCRRSLVDRQMRRFTGLNMFAVISVSSENLHRAQLNLKQAQLTCLVWHLLHKLT